MRSDLIPLSAELAATISRFRISGFAIVAEDLDESVAWYSRILGLTLVSEGFYEADDNGEAVPIRQALLRGLGLVLELLSSTRTLRQEWPDPPRHLYTTAIKTIVITTDDVAEASRYLRTRGVNFVWSDHLLPDGTSCSVITDPDGNLIEFIGPPGKPLMDDAVTKQSKKYPPDDAPGMSL